AHRSTIRVHPVCLLLDGLPELLVEAGALPGPGGAAGRVPRDRRQPRRGDRRATRCAGGSVPALSLPHDHELHRGLSERFESGQGHRRDQTDAGRAAARSWTCCCWAGWLGTSSRPRPSSAHDLPPCWSCPILSSRATCWPLRTPWRPTWPGNLPPPGVSKEDTVTSSQAFAG